MFENGEAAIVGNVGPLLEPVDRGDIDAGRAELPARLFSHNDQQSTWMALNSEGARGLGRPICRCYDCGGPCF